MKLEDLEVKFEKLYQNITTKNFLQMKSLGGEIPFYIFPYNIAQQQEVEKKTFLLQQRLKREGISILEINLYDLSLEILDNKGYLEKILQKESSLTKAQLFKTLQGILDIDQTVIPEIEKIVKNSNSSMVFLTGVGEVYPYMRSHTILNNLQNSIKDRPTVMFFPGTYSKELSLFGELKDDNYYRAFNLDTLNL